MASSMAVKEEPKDYSCMDNDDTTNASYKSHYSHRLRPPIPTIRAPTSHNQNNTSNNTQINNNNNNNNNTTTTTANNMNNIINNNHLHHHNQLPISFVTMKNQHQPLPQIPQQTSNATINKIQHQQQQQQQSFKTSQLMAAKDGQMAHKIQEPTIDMKTLNEKLIKVQQSRAYAMHTLTEHYSSVFNYKVCIKYHDEKEVYVVRVNNNTLKDVRLKLPIRAMYRYFFRSERDEFIEIEDDNAIVPYHDKDGQKIIYCQVFPADD